MATTSGDSVVLLSRALDQTGDVLARIHPEQFSDPTPCGDWNVAHLIQHVLRAPRNFIAMANDESPDWSAPSADVPSDWVSRFRSAADDLLHMWHQAGDSASAQAIDWQTAEFATHTWDLAKATGQPTDLDRAVGERAFDFMSQSLTPDNRGEAFGSEKSTSDDAPIYDRLAAFAGRDQR